MARQKYNSRVAAAIFALLSSDTYTVAEVCRIVKIAPSTYYLWRANYPEFFEGLKKAEAQRNEILITESIRSLLKKVKGYTIKEVQVITTGSGKFDVNGKEIPKVKEQRIIDRYIPADITAVIFTLTNLAPEQWKKTQTTEITGKGGKDLFNLSDEELNRKIADLERKLKQ